MNAQATSPVYGYRKQASMVDFPDRLAGVFFVSGCNFRCGYCHNLEQLGKRRPGLTWERLGRACDDLRRQWAKAVVITGGEPTLWDELPALVDFFRQQGFLVKLDTNGSRPDLLEAMLPRLAYVAMDLKASLASYPDVAQWAKTDLLVRSIELLLTADVPCEFRTTLLPGVHDEAELHAMGELIRGAPRYVLQPFLPRPDLPNPALRQQPRTTPATLRQAGDIMRPYVQSVVIRGA